MKVFYLNCQIAGREAICHYTISIIWLKCPQSNSLVSVPGNPREIAFPITRREPTGKMTGWRFGKSFLSPLMYRIKRPEGKRICFPSGEITDSFPSPQPFGGCSICVVFPLVHVFHLTLRKITPLIPLNVFFGSIS